MRSIHIPRLTGRRRAGPRTGSTRRLTLGLAVAVAAAMTLVAGAHYAASGRDRRPVRGDRGGGARHRVRGQLRHRRAGRRLQRHLD